MEIPSELRKKFEADATEVGLKPEETEDYIQRRYISYLANKQPQSLVTRVLTNLASGKRGEATELLVKAILNKNYIYTTRDDEQAEIWIYNHSIYIPEGKTFIREFCREILGEAYTPYLANTVIAKIEADTYIDFKEFFLNNYIEEIAVQNGLLNVFTKELRPFTPEKIFFNKLPIKYDSTKTCPKIISHFKTVLKNEEDVPVLEETFGYLLLKDYRFEKAFMFIGSGRNGKSKTLELMKRFLGAENCTNISLQQFETEQFALAELFSKMANLAGDIDRRALKNTGNFKNLTGVDIISASRKFLPKIHFNNYAKLIFCANELPKTWDTTEAFWNRWVLIEFPYTFVSQKELDALSEEEKKNYRLKDPEIIEKLTTEDELSGLLNLALEGLKRLLAQKDFSYSKSIAEVKDMWIRKSDSFSAFLMDCIEESYESKITKADLRRAYADYCKKYKIKMCSDKAIKNTLSINYGVIDDRDQSGGKQIPYWLGIKFNKNKESTGSKDSNGFSCYREKIDFPIELENPTFLTKFTYNEKGE